MIEFTVRVDTKLGDNPTISIGPIKGVDHIGGSADWIDKKKGTFRMYLTGAEQR